MPAIILWLKLSNGSRSDGGKIQWRKMEENIPWRKWRKMQWRKTWELPHIPPRRLYGKFVNGREIIAYDWLKKWQR